MDYIKPDTGIAVANLPHIYVRSRINVFKIGEGQKWKVIFAKKMEDHFCKTKLSLINVRLIT